MLSELWWNSLWYHSFNPKFRSIFQFFPFFSLTCLVLFFGPRNSLCSSSSNSRFQFSWRSYRIGCNERYCLLLFLFYEGLLDDISFFFHVFFMFISSILFDMTLFNLILFMTLLFHNAIYLFCHDLSLRFDEFSLSS